MAKRDPVVFNTPPGRMVGGSLYTGKTKDDAGVELTFKSGSQVGQKRTEYSFAIAIPKTQAHWANEPGWGQLIWAEGHASWPQGHAQRKDFSWKITDGDSTEPNSKMKRPCDHAGYPGNWILWFTDPSTPPKLAVALTGEPVWNDTPNFCLPGDIIEVKGSVASNESDKTAGVYLNVAAVCMRAYHVDGRIAGQSVDLASAGFGASPLPAGATTMPVGNALAPAAPAAPAVPPTTPGAPPVPATPAAAPAVPPAPVPVAVVPNAAVLGAPAPVTTPPPPVVAPPAPVAAPAVPVMLNGGDYKAHKDAGWTDEMMREKGWL